MFVDLDSTPQRNRTALLQGMHFHGKHVYGGTVDPDVIAERRRKNRAARKARRTTRRGR